MCERGDERGCSVGGETACGCNVQLYFSHKSLPSNTASQGAIISKLINNVFTSQEAKTKIEENLSPFHVGPTSVQRPKQGKPNTQITGEVWGKEGIYLPPTKKRGSGGVRGSSKIW